MNVTNWALQKTAECPLEVVDMLMNLLSICHGDGVSLDILHVEVTDLFTYLQGLSICQGDGGSLDISYSSKMALYGPAVGSCLELAICEAQIVVCVLQDWLLGLEMVCTIPCCHVQHSIACS